MAKSCGNISLFLVVTVCGLLVAVALQENELPSDFGRRRSNCSRFLLPLLWSNVKSAPWCGNNKKLYDPIRALHEELNKVEDKGEVVIHPTTRPNGSEDLGSVGPFVANILSGHSGPLCPQCPLIPVIPECPYIPPCPVCPTPVCPSLPPFPTIPPCPSFPTLVRGTSKFKMMSRNRIVKSNSSARPKAPPGVLPTPEGVIFITNTNGCTAAEGVSPDVNLAPCTRGSGASRGTIDVTFTAAGTSAMIGIASVSPTATINLTCTSFPSTFSGGTQSAAITPASPSVAGVGYVQFLASVGQDVANKSLKCFWSSS